MATHSDDCFYCKKCGGFIEYDRSRILLSSPPQYKGKCKDCENYVFEKVSNVDSCSKIRVGSKLSPPAFRYIAYPSTKV